MKIKTEQDFSCGEIEITIKYPKKDKQVQRIVDFLQSFDMRIRCDMDHADFRLYQLKDQLCGYGFVQISKSCILNINALESIRPIFNSRMEGTLKNSEKVYINRNYLGGVKEALKGAKI